MTVELVNTALQMAYARRETSPGLILHSDRGVQYRSREYQDYARSLGMKLSISRKVIAGIMPLWNPSTVV
ncbi:DDE-type integrase/transposase/recombinase [Gynuella sp.]|uniref:DDE-type integrase/transposase/recombinase n=1 Tax=Gynuella sp. TaxID=2969146 RepID=UPI003D0CBF49